MEELQKLSTHHCVLLAVHYASESNINALRILTALRADDLEFGLILRLLLTFLPEALEPSKYVGYLHELATNSRTASDDQSVPDTTDIGELSNAQARKKAGRLRILLQPLIHPLYERELELDPFTHFLIHRTHRIDAETGLLESIPQLVAPFLHHSEYLRTWFISTVLPLLRLGYEYYPQNPAPTLEAFARLTGKQAINTLLSNLRHKDGKGDAEREPARDLRGVVAPWICGTNDRKRRRLEVQNRDRRASVDPTQEQQKQEPDDWESLLEWLVHTSKQDYPLISSAFSQWDGPDDMDLGGFDQGQVYIAEDRRGHLERRYAQAMLATIYLVDDSSLASIQAAHSLVARLSHLLNLEPPPDLSAGTDLLPSHNTMSVLSEESTTSVLREENLLRSDNVITRPEENSVRLLGLFVFSAYLLNSLQSMVSVRDVARMYVRNDQAEQNSLLQKVLHSLGSGSKKDGEQWKATRDKLRWLWDWGSNTADGDRYGQGVLGKIESKTIETEILKSLLESGHYPLAVQLYIQTSDKPLSLHDVENIVLKTAMHHYDNASNGNRTRGGMKRASDIIAAFSSHFPSSSLLQRARALLSATHAMSFYTLILQHGVPFQPVNIRVTTDPLSLLRKLISQNHSSYTHLDDLISIGQNLVISMPSTLTDDGADNTQIDPTIVEKKKAAAERRVIGMAIEAALEEDDFETAYSYVVNRLSPTSGSPAVSPALSTSSQRFSFGSYESDRVEDEDGQNVAWRAALQAGRYGSSPMASSNSWSTSGSASTERPDLRRLEQRMELLSQALLLAPPSHLEEVLSVWQQCEKEMTALLAAETEEEERFNDMADRKLPGAFSTETVAIQPRREVGRGAVEEAPMGLFDVARGAAAAFSKSAFPLRAATGGTTTSPRDDDLSPGRVSMDLSESGYTSGGEERVRRRDMVANAVTGGLASGIGWVLGAKPVDQG